MTSPQQDLEPRGEENQPFWFTSAIGDTREPGSDVLARLIELVDAHHAVAAPRNDAERVDARLHYAGRREVLQCAAGAAGVAPGHGDLELLVRDSLRPFQFGEASGIRIQGPSVLLRAGPAQMLALVLHELTTNAIKFGALGGTSRRQTLEVQWQHQAGGVAFSWREGGVAILGPAGAPRTGFGRTLIEIALPRYCGASTRFALLPGGVHCAITFPVSALIY